LPPNVEKIYCRNFTLINKTVIVMNALKDTHPFELSIPLEAHRVAQRFRERQQDSGKGRQVYLNTLAVYAVHDYLQILGIAADLAASPSWDPLMQALSDTGALTVDNRGQLECRPVLPDADSCYIPPETWTDRLGYIAVQVDNALETATLIGFMPTVNVEEIPLQQFQPLENILDVLEPQQTVVTHLSQWLQETIEAGWSTLEALWTPQPAFSFRGNGSSLARLIASDDTISRCRPLNLAEGNSDDDFALIVSVKPHEGDELDIWVKVFPLGDQTHLPHDLELKLIDETGQPVMQAQSRETEALGLKFRGGWGDHFDIQIKTSFTTVVEHFMI
jgi:hypothetical protein